MTFERPSALPLPCPRASKARIHAAARRARPLRSRAARLALLLASLLVGAEAAVAQPAVASRTEHAQAERVEPRELLNSERIERRFGSYGIEVLEGDGAIRVSNLYSIEQGRRVGRTFAVVFYPESVNPALEDEHAEIQAGGSIGAVFAAGGWTVTKVHRYFGQIESSAKVAELMGRRPGEPLALHVYVFKVSLGAESFDYATIAEAHHPEYLTVDDLPRIYGPLETPTPSPEMRETLSAIAARMR